MKTTTGYILLQTLLFAYALLALTFIFGGSVSAWLFPGAFLLAAGVTASWQRDRRVMARATALSVALTALSIWLAILLPDCSYDGNYYHQSEIIHMLDGWNPYRNTEAAGIGIWERHYAKGFEMAATTVVAMTGAIESGKAVNLLLLLATGLIVYDVTGRLLPSSHSRTRLLLTLLFTLNPIGVLQAFVYYIDFTKYYYILLTLCFTYLICSTGKRRYYWLLLGVATLAAATKFNIFFEEGVWLIGIFIWLIIKHRNREAWGIFATGAAAVIVGGLVLGYHPYITNCLIGGNPFYPLIGGTDVDIMTSNTPAEFQGRNRFSAFFISLVKLQAPSCDSRFGGFGPLMAPLLLISILLLAAEWKRVPGAIKAAAILCFASCFFFAQSWWARYISQLWLVVPLTAMTMAMIGKARFWTKTLCMLAVLDICFVGMFALVKGVCYNINRDYLLGIHRGDTVRVENVNPSIIRHYREMGTTVTELPDGSLSPDSAALFLGNANSADAGSFPMVELTPKEYETWMELPSNRFINRRGN